MKIDKEFEQYENQTQKKTNKIIQSSKRMTILFLGLYLFLFGLLETIYRNLYGTIPLMLGFLILTWFAIDFKEKIWITKIFNKRRSD